MREHSGEIQATLEHLLRMTQHWMHLFSVALILLCHKRRRRFTELQWGQ